MAQAADDGFYTVQGRCRENDGRTLVARGCKRIAIRIYFQLSADISIRLGQLNGHGELAPRRNVALATVDVPIVMLTGAIGGQLRLLFKTIQDAAKELTIGVCKKPRYAGIYPSELFAFR